MSFRGGIAALLEAGFAASHPGLRVRSDQNTEFAPTADVAYIDLAFVDGSEQQASMGGDGGSLFRAPIGVYVSAVTPLNVGDGLATELVERAKVLLRRQSVEDARWERFEAGPEGPDRGEYRKQLVSIFRRSLRV